MRSSFTYTHCSDIGLSIKIPARYDPLHTIRSYMESSRINEITTISTKLPNTICALKAVCLVMVDYIYYALSQLQVETHFAQITCSRDLGLCREKYHLVSVSFEETSLIDTQSQGQIEASMSLKGAIALIYRLD